MFSCHIDLPINFLMIVYNGSSFSQNLRKTEFSNKFSLKLMEEDEMELYNFIKKHCKFAKDSRQISL